MRTNRKTTRGVFGSLLMIAAGCALSFAAAAASSVEEELKQCAALQDQAARLACYDGIVARMPGAEPPTPEVTAPVVEQPSEEAVVVAAEQASDEAESIAADAEQVSVVAAAAEQASDEAAAAAAAEEAAAAKAANDEQLATLGQPGEQLEVQARVVRCTRDSRRRYYYFYLENGQIWKQKSDRRLRYKECNFNVTITKDFFGYRMVPEGETGKIRIARVK